MRLLKVVAPLVVCVIILAGCGNRSPIAGDWTTKEKFGDSSVMAIAKMTLVHDGDVVSGTFTFTSLPDETLEKLKTTEFSLEQVRFSDSHISFVVPILPDDPSECLLFNLKLEGGVLKGSLKENDPKRKKSIPVEFQKD